MIMEYVEKELKNDEVNFLISELNSKVSEVQFSKQLQLRIVNYILLLYAVAVGIFKLNKNYSFEPVVLWIISFGILIVGIRLLVSCKKSQDNNNKIAEEIRSISKTYSEIEKKLEKKLQKTSSEYVICIWIGILILGFIAESWCLLKLSL